MKIIKYQQKAVGELVNKIIDLLSLSGNRHILVFKAPTGSGKTVMASQMLMRLNSELAERPDSPYTEVSYIWIAPNKLHEQSYFKMKNYFTETQALHPVIYDEVDHSSEGYIKPGEILFVNWESINKDNAVMIRETELSASIYDLTRRTQEVNGVPIIVIIDEEHMFTGKNAKQSEKVLANIEAKIEIHISATPLPETTAKADEQVNVPREKVIEEEMIKRGVVLNPDLKFNEALGSLNQQLIYLAIKKREELAEAYRKINVKINPLLLIQLPNDGENMDKEDYVVRDEVVTYLDKIKSITTENGKLAIWLNNEKTENLKDIVNNDDLTEILLFKEAISKGWDCPRAAVLLIFREIKSFTFSAQTVGRILRMPEQHYYQDDILNRGYVYTNLSRDIIEIVKDDMDYISSLHAVRKKNLNNVNLISEYNERTSAEHNRLGSDFKQCLINTIEQEWQVKNIKSSLFTIAQLEGKEEEITDEDRVSQTLKNKKAVESIINFNIKNISIDIVNDLSITGEVGKTMISNKTKYVRTKQELNIAFMAFCTKMLGNTFEKVSVKTLAMALCEVMDELFEIFDFEAIKTILHKTNRDKFENVIKKALYEYSLILQKRHFNYKSKGFIKYNWEIPADNFYNEENHILCEDVVKYAMDPCIQRKDASEPEKNFETFLEAHREYINWWYKNGDSGKQNYSISYTNVKGEKSLFYVDFIIRMKNGQIFLFDTKGQDSDINAPNKHNALIDYINNKENKDKNLKGGIIIQMGENWKYSTSKIKNTTDIVNWNSFYPEEYK